MPKVAGLALGKPPIGRAALLLSITSFVVFPGDLDHYEQNSPRRLRNGNYVLCPLSFFVPPSQAGVRSRLSLLRELGRSFRRRVLGNPNHRNLASTIRRRALPRRRPPRDGEGRTGPIHRFALLLNFKFTGDNPMQKTLLIGYHSCPGKCRIESVA